MKKIVLLCLGLLVTVFLFSCKKTAIKNTENNFIDYDWSKMNYNMLSSVIYDIQMNPEKYVDKKIKVSGNFHTSVYEGIRYYSVLVWDPTGCCPTGFDFNPPPHMKATEDFPSIDDKITVTGILKIIEKENQKFLEFQAEEVYTTE